MDYTYVDYGKKEIDSLLEDGAFYGRNIQKCIAAIPLRTHCHYSGTGSKWPQILPHAHQSCPPCKLFSQVGTHSTQQPFSHTTWVRCLVLEPVLAGCSFRCTSPSWGHEIPLDYRALPLLNKYSCCSKLEPTIRMNGMEGILKSNRRVGREFNITKGKYSSISLSLTSSGEYPRIALIW